MNRRQRKRKREEYTKLLSQIRNEIETVGIKEFEEGSQLLLVSILLTRQIGARVEDPEHREYKIRIGSSDYIDLIQRCDIEDEKNVIALCVGLLKNRLEKIIMGNEGER